MNYKKLEMIEAVALAATDTDLNVYMRAAYLRDHMRVYIKEHKRTVK